MAVVAIVCACGVCVSLRALNIGVCTNRKIFTHIFFATSTIELQSLALLNSLHVLFVFICFNSVSKYAWNVDYFQFYFSPDREIYTFYYYYYFVRV